MLHEVENAGMHIAKLSASVYGVNMLPDVLNVGNDNNLVTRSVKKGFLLYVANELVEQLTTGSSNFGKMGSVEGWKALVDDSVFFGVGEAVDESTGFTRGVTASLSNGYLPPNVVAAGVVGTYLYGIKSIGSKLENSAVKSITSLFA